SMSWLLLAFWTMSFSPSARAAACVSLISDSEAGFFGLIRSPITAAFGTSSWSNSSRLGASVLYRKVVPVILPPGRLRLETRPSLTASPPIEKTIGMVAPLISLPAARQGHRKDRALAWLARHGHVATHHAREFAGNGKTEPRATVALCGRGVGLDELLEQLCLLLKSHADAGVGDRELDPVVTVGDPACA